MQQKYLLRAFWWPLSRRDWLPSVAPAFHELGVSWVLSAGSVLAPDKFGKPVCDPSQTLWRFSGAKSSGRSPNFASYGSIGSASRRSQHSRCWAWAGSNSGLADAEHPASQSNTDALPIDGFLRHLTASRRLHHFFRWLPWGCPLSIVPQRTSS